MPKLKPADWTPPYNAYCGRFDPNEVAIALLGFQTANASRATDEAAQCADRLQAAGARVVDRVVRAGGTRGHEEILVSYWKDYETCPLTGGGLDQELAARYRRGEVGWWLEAFGCTSARFETSSSTPTISYGVATLAEWQPDDRIGYPGAARDRIQEAEDEGLGATVRELRPRRLIEAQGQAIEVLVPGNICFIRTVQGWAGAPEDERRTFLSGPYQKYLEGVAYLHANPRESGCAAVRLADGVSKQLTSPQKETLAWFTSLADMEEWVWFSPTHGEIIRAFADYAERFSMDIKVSLSHEVYVPSPGQMRALYVNVEPETGFLGWFRARPLAVY